ncbi:MAG: DUF29 domain-containing protein [Deltaproteobacteria bacterium]|nr:DUF29 domain-containing protein [Deltaproteobacteria bacterium]
MEALYDKDFLKWTHEQAELLRAGKLTELDALHLAEEVESMGKNDQRALRATVRNILVHLLLLGFSRSTEPRPHWREEIVTFRADLLDLLEDSPSLQAHVQAAMEKGWEQARKIAEARLAEYGDPADWLPVRCPYTWEQIKDAAFFPGR